MRWPAGDGKYVELLEHRAVMGNPAEGQVHHINGVKDDNRPENLVVLSPAEHAAEHATIDVERAAALYAQGIGTPEIGRRLGCNPAAVWRALERHGYQTRDAAAAGRARAHDLPMDLIRRLMEGGCSDRRVAELFGVKHIVMRDRRKQLGLPPRRQGRMNAQQVAQMEATIAGVLADG